MIRSSSSSNLKITTLLFLVYMSWFCFKSDFFNPQENPLKEEKCSCYNSKIDSCLVRRRVSASLNCEDKRILQKMEKNCFEDYSFPVKSRASVFMLKSCTSIFENHLLWCSFELLFHSSVFLGETCLLKKTFFPVLPK